MKNILYDVVCSHLCFWWGEENLHGDSRWAGARKKYITAVLWEMQFIDDKMFWLLNNGISGFLLAIFVFTKFNSFLFLLLPAFACLIAKQEMKQKITK